MVGLKAWVVVLPSLVAASELGQWLLDKLVPPGAGARAFDHSPTGSGVLPLLLSVTFVAAAAGLLLDVRRPSTVSVPRRIFALLPLCIFVAQEHVEYIMGQGERPWTVSLHWSFAVGLLLQVPAVLGAYVLARLLIHVAARVWRNRDSDVRAAPGVLVVSRPTVRTLPTQARALGNARLTRGPPLPSV
jgi:hypothetical protein